MEIAEKIQRLTENIEKVFVGKPEAVKMIIVGLLSSGHLLIEDVPGVGKTILAKTLARSIDCIFRRVQFTPDLLPSDIVGVSIFNEATEKFVFKQGPIFANVVLADEINRTPPRTQSALLEAMNDFQVSVDGVTHMLSMPFIVIATQNPYEFEGTYPLPESQLDRFLMRIRLGYPDADGEKKVLFSQKLAHPIDSLTPVLTGEEIVGMQSLVRRVRVDDSLAEYIVNILTQTRNCDRIDVGVSPRGGLSIFRAAQALALVEGRDYCIPDDIKKLAVCTLSHRLLDRSPGRNGKPEEIIQEIVDTVSVPS